LDVLGDYLDPWSSAFVPRWRSGDSFH
jgi:hypothetical protein